MDSQNDQTVPKPHSVQHYEPSDHHKTPSREEDIVLETNTILVPSPLTPHPYVSINVNLQLHVNYQMEEFKTVIFDNI